MNDYSGKVCPFCKSPFAPDDDIVVCSACDMPHHKECWIENQGCTTFGCMGTIQSTNNVATSVTATQMHYDDSEASAAGTVFCTRCGTQNPGTAAFCTRCGNQLVRASAYTPQANTQAGVANADLYAYAYRQSPPDQSSGYPYAGGYGAQQGDQAAGADADLQRLVGTATEYYMSKFQTMKRQGDSASWNWPAFLVAPYWMFYRKMYTWGIAVLAVDIIISLIGSVFVSLPAIAGYIALGVWGNSIYLKHLEEKCSQVKTMTEPYKTQFIAQNGGVNEMGAVLAVIVRALLMVISVV